MKLKVLASGSAGNSLLVESGGTAVLVDAGLSGTEIGRRLHAVDCKPEDLAGIIVSHEHSDHCQGVGVLARRHQVPVYITEATLAVASRRLGRLPEFHLFQAETEGQGGELRVRPGSRDCFPPSAATPSGDLSAAANQVRSATAWRRSAARYWA